MLANILNLRYKCFDFTADDPAPPIFAPDTGAKGSRHYSWHSQAN